MSPARFEEIRAARMELVSLAAAFYSFDSLHVFRREERKARLLAAGILYNLDAEQAAILEDITEERKRG